MSIGEHQPDRGLAEQIFSTAEKDRSAALAALGQLYRAYIRQVARKEIPPTLRARISTSSVAQRTLIRLQSQAEPFECRSLAEFENYLLTTARSVLADLRRFHLANKRSVLRETSITELESRAFLQGLLGSPGLNPAELVSEVDERRMQKSKLDEIMQHLPNHYQKILREHFVNGKSYHEIGQILGRSPDAVRMLIQRALRALKQLLDEGGGGTSDEPIR